ncbi:MAG TPA: sigma 54-interacting transcriptional regulator [Terriglobia bacterium]|nr:sigma 54-interacting transcriptional regulator [Terriglobia bacterium]
MAKTPFPLLFSTDGHDVRGALGRITSTTEIKGPSISHKEDEMLTETNCKELVGDSAALRSVLRQVKIVAFTESTVLIYGETKTGKELVARALHNLGPRRSNSFVKLNCAAIPSGLLESELFGYERGAFTGAIMHEAGRLESADRGTLFLDEIGDIPVELQLKLLRVLQEREFERLGSTRTQKIDVRLVAATHRNLERMIAEKQFRSDLYYRLSVFPIEVPPLRERTEDVPLLVHHFIQQFAQLMHRAIETIPNETIEALQKYSWPGNIRELQNLMERAVLLSSGSVLEVPLRHLHARTSREDRGKIQTLVEVEREHIQAALREADWVISGPNGAAAQLGLKRSTLQYRMKKFGIVRPQLMLVEP